VPKAGLTYIYVSLRLIIGQRSSKRFSAADSKVANYCCNIVCHPKSPYDLYIVFDSKVKSPTKMKEVEWLRFV
jgi:hypothetical protein